MSITALLLLCVILILIVGCSPRWPYATSWGYAPTSLGFILLVAFLVLVYTGKIHLHVN